MSDRRKQYPFDEIEARWQRHWEEKGTFRALSPGDPGFDPDKPKYYVLDMFPYPSGDGLHVGHAEGYTATDIVSRFMRMRGYNVMHPMGWDAFGLPAEQYAIKTGQHPRVTTDRNTDRFRTQLKRLGFSYDWDREINTTDPGYFKWTQWIFLQLYHAYVDDSGRARPIAELEKERAAACPEEGEADRRAYLDSRRLAYVAEVPVNWCAELGTVLANEEVKEGKSEVGGFPVEKRPMRQWMLRITDYAQRLLDELEVLDWPEGIKTMQREWIGRSEGAEVDFMLEGTGESLRVFTTRPDTLFGATYMVLAPEHPLVDTLTVAGQREAVASYRSEVANKSDLERTELAKEKSGVFTGGYAVNPVNDERIPVWIADYVLMTYGTGAIMAVPAHDERDHEFAQAFELPIREVVKAPGGDEAGESCFSGEGIAVNSGLLDGLETPEAKRTIIDWLEERGKGERKVNFKLRDWLFSRQRYWGEPFPILWREGKHEPLDECELPVEAPEMDDFRPTGTAEPPLAKAVEWVAYSDEAARETNTMPQWAGSCWYYLRFADPRNSESFLSPEAEQYWLNSRDQAGSVDLYVGGAEHAVLHLLYARFWHKVLFDLGYLSRNEPFHRLVNQGLILGPDSQKMSKSRGNVINPDDVIADYGADALRLYEMFMGPLEQVKPWSDRGVEGLYRFLGRVWRLFMDQNQEGEWVLSPTIVAEEPEKELNRLLHETIKKVTEDTERMAFNTAIAQMMVFVKGFTGADRRSASALRTFLILLNPYAPHLTEELNVRLSERLPGDGGDGKLELAEMPWPGHDESALAQNEVQFIVQVNGKLRDRIMVPAEIDKEALISKASASKARDFLEGELVKTIVVPGKLVNFVVRS